MLVFGEVAAVIRHDADRHGVAVRLYSLMSVCSNRDRSAIVHLVSGLFIVISFGVEEVGHQNDEIGDG